MIYDASFIESLQKEMVNVCKDLSLAQEAGLRAERRLLEANDLLIQTTDGGPLTEGWKLRRDIYLSKALTGKK